MPNETMIASTPAKETLLDKADWTTAVKKYTPKGQSPKVYFQLISDLMGRDKNGQERPFSDVISFLYICSRTGLDPILKQIYAVYRWDYRLGKERMVVQTGIDGMRLTAQRTKQYAGQDDIVFTPEDESTKYPTKATCTVYKNVNGTLVKFTASARWSEYAQYSKTQAGSKLSDMWERMPYNQLGKCAEALALRKGFPNELSGVYSEEEMTQSTTVALEPLPTPGVVAGKSKGVEAPAGEIEVVHGEADDAKVDEDKKGQLEDVKPVEGTITQPPKKSELPTPLKKQTASDIKDEVTNRIASLREAAKKRTEEEVAQNKAQSNA